MRPRAVPDLGRVEILAEELTTAHIGRNIGWSLDGVYYLGELTNIHKEEPSEEIPYRRTFLHIGSTERHAFSPGEAVVMLPPGAEWVIKHRKTTP